MISSAFVGKPILAVSHSTNSGRWINNALEIMPNEVLFTAETLKSDVRFLVTNSYIE